MVTLGTMLSLCAYIPCGSISEVVGLDCYAGSRYLSDDNSAHCPTFERLEYSLATYTVLCCSDVVEILLPFYNQSVNGTSLACQTHSRSGGEVSLAHKIGTGIMLLILPIMLCSDSHSHHLL